MYLSACFTSWFCAQEGLWLQATSVWFHQFETHECVILQDKKKEDKKDEISLEELIEKERAALGPSQTKVNLESFLAWKKRKLREKEETAAKENSRKKAEFKAGRNVGVS